MVFSSVPIYLDHPNWQLLQQPDHQQGCGSESYPLRPPSPAAETQGGVGGGGAAGGSIKPASMVDRARLAKIPQPEAGLKCPRCDSTNTKFCYFNNYSLSQPRHFCKTCRRYWTRGGALRNVPVGGGYRRNKRKSKNRSSKSEVPAEQEQHMAAPNSTSASPSSCSADMPTSHFSQLLSPPQFPFMAALQNLAQYGGGHAGVGGFQSKIAATSGAGEANLGFVTGSNYSGGHISNLLSAGGISDQWRLPLFTGVEPPANFYPYQSEAVLEPRSSMLGDSELPAMEMGSGISINTQVPPVKMEENQGFNLSRYFMGISENNQYWDGNSWTEISGLNPSSTSGFKYR
ncbi:hypothetical protein U1Q18_020868 [Sarracenia purpurea var. burkii]